MTADRERAERRRRQWSGGVARTDEASSFERAFWANASVADKLDALRTMADEAAMMEGHGSSARLQRHLGGLRRARR
jgi:hypothetical protein